MSPVQAEARGVRDSRSSLSTPTRLTFAVSTYYAAILQLVHFGGKVVAGGVMAGDQYGDAFLLHQPGEQLKNLASRFAIQVAGRFVSDQHRRAMREGAGDRQALLLAARHLERPVIGPAAKPDKRETVGGPLSPLRGRDP